MSSLELFRLLFLSMLFAALVSTHCHQLGMGLGGVVGDIRRVVLLMGRIPTLMCLR
jgi:hypothetical protein